MIEERMIPPAISGRRPNGGPYRCAAMIALFLSTGQVVSAQDQEPYAEPPPEPIAIPEDVKEALSMITQTLTEDFDVKRLESVVIVTRDGTATEFSFATAEGVAAAKDTFEIPGALLDIPSNAGDHLEWIDNYKWIRIKYGSSPGVSLDCGNKHGGRRKCRQY